MSTFTGSSGHGGSDGSRPPSAPSARPFDDDGFIGYDPRLPSQRFDSSFSDFTDTESVKESADESVPIFSTNEDTFSSSQMVPESPLPPMFSAAQGAPAAFRRRETKEEGKEILTQIIEEADEFKQEFYRKRQIAVENRKASNREKEKQFVVSREQFHAEAPKNHWKAVAELIPREVPTIEKRGKKEKQLSISVIQGPKRGKPTDMSRMWHIVVNLKHNPPPHMKPEVAKDAKAAPPPTPAASAAPKAVVSSAWEIEKACFGN
ncbi:hypothetical protein Ancab_015242 [Ancistrocladus abbreviatus]